MGLRDFFFRPLSFERFAQQFIRELQRAGATEALTFDRENARIVRGAPSNSNSISLGNFYKEYLSLPALQRARHLTASTRLMATEQDDLPNDFEVARSHLRPKVWSRTALTKSELQSELDGSDKHKFEMPEYEIGSHLVASIAYDLPQSIRSLSNANLQDWGISYYEALEIARENLEQVPFVVGQIGDGCYTSATGDSYDACRLLVPAFIEKWKVKGDLIAMVPNRPEHTRFDQPRSRS